MKHFFPDLGITVEAETREEALEIIKGKQPKKKPIKSSPSK